MASTITYTDNLQCSTESQASTIPFASVPEIYGDNIFDLDKNPNKFLVAENLASEAKNLINILETTQRWEVREKFQIELRKLNIHDDQCFTYKMSLRIDPILWFKYHAQNGSDVKSLERLYENGCCYHEKVKSEIERDFDMKSDDEIKRLKFNSPFTEWCGSEHYVWCRDENYDNTGKCNSSKFSRHRNDYFHFSNFHDDVKAVYRCRYESIKLNGKQEVCLFSTNPNCRIYADTVEKPSCCPYFIANARPDATSVITLNPIKHCSNEEYVKTCDAWQAVLQTLNYIKEQLKLDKLPLNRIYVNFGKWMTQKAKDPTSRYCHAHINIVLTRETIDKITDRNQSKNKTPLFASLVGSILPPETHRLDDAWELLKYIASQMIPIVFKDNRELKRIVSTLENKLEKLEHEYENLRQLICGIPPDGQEIEESANITDEFDIGRGINDALVMQEYQQDSNEKWNRFLFPWNQI